VVVVVGKDAGGREGAALFRSLKCFHLPFSLGEPRLFSAPICRANGPDNLFLDV